jgi:hypothetical protein
MHKNKCTSVQGEPGMLLQVLAPGEEWLGARARKKIPPASGSALVGPLEKRHYSSLWPLNCLFVLIVALVSGATPLAGPVAFKRSSLKNILF